MARASHPFGNDLLSPSSDEASWFISSLIDTCLDMAALVLVRAAVEASPRARLAPHCCRWRSRSHYDDIPARFKHDMRSTIKGGAILLSIQIKGYVTAHLCRAAKPFQAYVARRFYCQSFRSRINVIDTDQNASCKTRSASSYRRLY